MSGRPEMVSQADPVMSLQPKVLGWLPAEPRMRHKLLRLSYEPVLTSPTLSSCPLCSLTLHMNSDIALSCLRPFAPLLPCPECSSSNTLHSCSSACLRTQPTCNSSYKHPCLPLLGPSMWLFSFVARTTFCPFRFACFLTVPH